MWFASRRGSPVDLERAFLIEDDIVDDFGIEDFGEVCLDQGDRVLGTQRRRHFVGLFVVAEKG
jgi:hypothetical protein